VRLEGKTGSQWGLGDGLSWRAGDRISSPLPSSVGERAEAAEEQSKTREIRGKGAGRISRMGFRGPLIKK